MREPATIPMGSLTLKEVLEEHEAWVHTRGKTGMPADLSKLDLQHVNFKNTCLVAAKLAGARFQGACFDYADLRGVDLSFTHLQKATFRHAKLDFALFQMAKLGHNDFSHASLKKVSLHCLELSNINFQHADLTASNFSFSVLKKVNFTRTKLYFSRFRRTHLHQINLRRAHLYRANFTGVHIYGSRLHRLISWLERAYHKRIESKALKQIQLAHRQQKELELAALFHEKHLTQTIEASSPKAHPDDLNEWLEQIEATTPEWVHLPTQKDIGKSQKKKKKGRRKSGKKKR